jgi:SET domain-containing protein
LRQQLRQSLSKVYVGRSSIHGSGLFAREPISDGEEIGRFEGRRTRRDGRYVLWVAQGRSGYRGIEGTTDLRYVNHSSAPNAEFVQDVLVALAPIAPGDEITCHYGPDWEAEPESEPNEVS